MEDLKFSYLNFNPDYNERRILNQVGERILFKAPSGACLRVQFEKNQKGIVGRAILSSFSGRFEAIGKSKKLTQVMFRIERNLKKQLRQWRRQRFLDRTWYRIKEGRNSVLTARRSG